MEENLFDKIRHTDENSSEYWMARELAAAIGYKDFRNFKGLIEKVQNYTEANCRNFPGGCANHELSYRTDF